MTSSINTAANRPDMITNCIYLFIFIFIPIYSYKSADEDCTKEIKRRIALARQKAVVLASIWKDRNIKTATKVKEYEWRHGLWVV